MAPVQVRHFSRIEYDRLIARGAFDTGQKVELLAGQLVVREPQGSPHATAIGLGLEALRAAFELGWSVRVQLPIALDDESEPEPDLAVVPGRPRDYARAHPARPVLIVEVSERSLDLDREHKGGLYARAGIADYWIVNLVDLVVEIHRAPEPAPGTAYGWRYSEVTRAHASDSVTPLAAPAARIAVADLLP